MDIFTSMEKNIWNWEVLELLIEDFRSKGYVNIEFVLDCSEVEQPLLDDSCGLTVRW